jgi:hypothetical protein
METPGQFDNDNNADNLKYLEEAKTESKQLLANLASKLWGKDIDKLTKEDILLAVKLELSSLPAAMTIHVEETRRTKLDYCNSRYGLDMELDMTNMASVIEGIVLNAENPIEGFIEASSRAKAFIRSKFDRSENLLRTLINESASKDGLEVLPGSRYARGE